ncbi:MAG: peptide chain release factor N(5)-glutamine methyltransferase [Bryobacteraceae bacterium]|nr:peptide chain release factor N(5)-glutamine methyltransferase [Bryobacteraceae bacterium]
MRLQTALRQGSEILASAGIPEPRLTAEVLLCHALRRERAWLYAHPEHELTTVEWIHYGRYLHERLQGRPVQYITRKQEFYGREFEVTPAVLIPRPETEHVVEQALKAARGARRVLDICTGSGNLAVTLALELGAAAVGTDISFAALEVARRNARRHGARVEWVQCDLASGLSGRFDLIVSNPPYIPLEEIARLQREVRDYEPRLALEGGPGGAAFYPRIVREAERLLAPGGWLIVEIGYQGEQAARCAFGPAWTDAATEYDLAGWPRVVRARFAP